MSGPATSRTCCTIGGGGLIKVDRMVHLSTMRRLATSRRLSASEVLLLISVPALL